MHKIQIEKDIPDTSQRTMQNECYSCRFKANIPGYSHISCRKPDYDMTGDKDAKQCGWFHYPLLFDPVWKTKMCGNWQGI